MRKIIAGLPALLVAIPLIAFADHSVPENNMSPEIDGSSEQVCAIWSTLGMGSRGKDVSCLQQHLIEEGHLGIKVATGYYGDMTKSAVMKWQQAHGIAPTGYFGSLSQSEFGGHKVNSAPAAEVVHAHAPFNVDAWPSKPAVSIQLHPDTMSGYNLEIKTENFRFAPEHVNGAVVPNEGHTHLMIDGKKISRVYGNWYHIPKELLVGAGPHTVLVTLNANDHSDLAAHGVRIEAKVEVHTN